MGDMSIKTRGLHYSPMLSTNSISNVSQIPSRVGFEKKGYILYASSFKQNALEVHVMIFYQHSSAVTMVSKVCTSP